MRAAAPASFVYVQLACMSKCRWMHYLYQAETRRPLTTFGIRISVTLIVPIPTDEVPLYRSEYEHVGPMLTYLPVHDTYCTVMSLLY